MYSALQKIFNGYKKKIKKKSFFFSGQPLWQSPPPHLVDSSLKKNFLWQLYLIMLASLGSDLDVHDARLLKPFSMHNIFGIETLCRIYFLDLVT